MNEQSQFNGESAQTDASHNLARWLHAVFTVPAQERDEHTVTEDEAERFELSFEKDSHPRFYRQLPDFIRSLLQNEPHVTEQYAPLLYHLAWCRACHATYLDLYDPIRATLETGGGHSVPTQGTRPFAMIPPQMLVHLCQLLISQAEALLLSAQQDGIEDDPAARSLLQLAIRVSTHISQSGTRLRALMDLVRVATIFVDAESTQTQHPVSHSFSTLAGAGKPHAETIWRRGEKATLPMETPVEQPTLYVQANDLLGTIAQDGDRLELALHDLPKTLYGHFLVITVPLGSLIEPVRWIGGNPLLIRSIVPVDEHGTLRTPLGQTSLRLSNAEEYNLLEVLFLRLEVRSAD